jgi:hypothetical protein
MLDKIYNFGKALVPPVAVGLGAIACSTPLQNVSSRVDPRVDPYVNELVEIWNPPRYSCLLGVADGLEFRNGSTTITIEDRAENAEYREGAKGILDNEDVLHVNTSEGDCSESYSTNLDLSPQRAVLKGFCGNLYGAKPENQRLVGKLARSGGRVGRLNKDEAAMISNRVRQILKSEIGQIRSFRR